ncbi:MAG: hypothetical protein J3K34DRAFT_417122 [Monoraphidium minutum]|nr:MAG: hypothetical protein J3K34DRAFT_417122 [Monoraphidium minutum]
MSHQKRACLTKSGHVSPKAGMSHQQRGRGGALGAGERKRRRRRRRAKAGDSKGIGSSNATARGDGSRRRDGFHWHGVWTLLRSTLGGTRGAGRGTSAWDMNNAEKTPKRHRGARAAVRGRRRARRPPLGRRRASRACLGEGAHSWLRGAPAAP